MLRARFSPITARPIRPTSQCIVVFLERIGLTRLIASAAKT